MDSEYEYGVYSATTDHLITLETNPLPAVAGMSWIHSYPVVQVEHEVVIVNKIYLLKVNQGYIEMKYLEIYSSKENDLPQVRRAAKLPPLLLLALATTGEGPRAATTPDGLRAGRVRISGALPGPKAPGPPLSNFQQSAVLRNQYSNDIDMISNCGRCCSILSKGVKEK
uniref:Uncharacterized protein n=1 Tax=Glossina pallidipes TaxID=7398 RepID=A0A1A9Z996_GLOPL